MGRTRAADDKYEKGDPEARVASSLGAGNGSRTRDIDLGKVALYH